MNQFQFLENQSQPELSELDIFEQDFSPEGIQNLLNAGYEPQQINEMITNKYEADAGGQKIVPYVPTGAEQRVDAFGKFLQGLGSFGDQYLGGLFLTFEDPYEAQKMSGKLLRLVDPYQQGGIGEFLPGFSYELATERKDRLGQALSLLDYIPGGAVIGAPAKQAIKSSIISSTKGIASLSDDALDLQRIIDDPNLSNADKVKQFKDHPAIINAEKQMSELTPTNTMPGYGTPEWAANRQFNFPNKDIVGYEDAVDELYKGGRSMAYVEQGLEVPVDIMTSTPGKEKIATYVIGPPASGKSAISNPLAVKYNATIIDPDEAKKVLPEFQGGIGGNAVHVESQEIISDVAKIAIARGDNLVIPTVGAKSEKLRNNIRKLQDEGYTVNLVLADIDPNLAMVRMNSRFIKEGRLINSDAAADYAGKPNIVYDNFKMEGIADGYGKIDTTTRIGEPKQIFDDTAEIFKDSGL